MIPPPATIDSARVIEFAWSDTPFGHINDTEGNVADVIHGLAICQYGDSKEIYRFSCNGDWDTCQDSSYDSVENAKSQLPIQYTNAPVHWCVYDKATAELRKSIHGKHGFYIASMPSSRKADYYLGCHGGSVFIDFNRLSSDQICLIRISFDGYDCCSLPESVVSMDGDDSARFIDQVESDKINQDEMAKIVMASIKKNQDMLWIDALQEYELI